MKVTQESELGMVCGELLSEEDYPAWVARHQNVALLGVKRMVFICYGNLPDVDSVPSSDQAHGMS